MSNLVTMNMAEIKRANKDAGQYFFEPDTLRFFGSRISEQVYGDGYFVTSEQGRSGFGSLGHAWNGQRLYTVRRAMADGSIDTVSEFGEYATLREAKSAASYFADRQANGLNASNDRTRSDETMVR